MLLEQGDDLEEIRSVPKESTSIAGLVEALSARRTERLGSALDPQDVALRLSPAGPWGTDGQS